MHIIARNTTLPSKAGRFYPGFAEYMSIAVLQRCLREIRNAAPIRLFWLQSLGWLQVRASSIVVRHVMFTSDSSVTTLLLGILTCLTTGWWGQVYVALPDEETRRSTHVLFIYSSQTGTAGNSFWRLARSSGYSSGIFFPIVRDWQSLRENSEGNLITVAHLQSRLPGHYWFLVVSSVIDGLLGGDYS